MTKIQGAFVPKISVKVSLQAYLPKLVFLFSIKLNFEDTCTSSSFFNRFVCFLFTCQPAHTIQSIMFSHYSLKQGCALDSPGCHKQLTFDFEQLEKLTFFL